MLCCAGVHDGEKLAPHGCHGRHAEIDALLRTCHGLGALYSLGCTWHAPAVHASPIAEPEVRDVISLSQYLLPDR